MSVVAVTGCSGYIGSRLLRFMDGSDKVSRIIGVDVNPPRYSTDKMESHNMDVRDPALTNLFSLNDVETIVHLAFIVNPLRNDALMHDIDVNGTQNVLEAASRSEVPHVLVASSTTAYGAWPDNPVPLTEEDPVRGMPNYEYARDKTEIDRISQLWAAKHPDRTMTIVRPVSCSLSIRCRTSSPVVESRLPVGSSARRSDGSLMSARAIATRWRSPPESCAGMWWVRPESPTSSRSSLACSWRFRFATPR